MKHKLFEHIENVCRFVAILQTAGSVLWAVPTRPLRSVRDEFSSETSQRPLGLSSAHAVCLKVGNQLLGGTVIWKTFSLFQDHHHVCSSLYRPL